MKKRKLTIHGHRYYLSRVGKWHKLWALSRPILDSVGWAKIQTGILHDDGTCYHFQWFQNWEGSPVYIVHASKEDIEQWDELKRYRGKEKAKPALMWVRVTMPEQLYCTGPCWRCDEKRMEDWV
jgi:hypothetical protein